MINLEAIELEMRLGYVSRQDHPTLPLSIYNYTPPVQYEGRWNDVTRACRGLVIEKGTGRVVAQPWPKFFNLSEHVGRGESMPLAPWEATDKMDGSLGIVFYYRGAWRVATRGSFVSEQAMEARQMLKKLYVDNAPTDTTLLFEIIYPENRIVVDYGDERKLVLIGARSAEKDYKHHELATLAERIGCEVTPLLASGDGVLNELPVRTNAEGYVIRYDDGFRVKIKHEEYVRLHAILTKVSSYTVWEFLRDRRPIEEMLYAVPDEFHQWVTTMERKLRIDLARVQAKAAVEVTACRRPTRKETALAWQERGRRVPAGIFFGVIDGQDIRHLLFDLIKPPYERPFGGRPEISEAA